MEEHGWDMSPSGVQAAKGSHAFRSERESFQLKSQSSSCPCRKSNVE